MSLNNLFGETGKSWHINNCYDATNKGLYLSLNYIEHFEELSGWCRPNEEVLKYIGTNKSGSREYEFEENVADLEIDLNCHVCMNGLREVWIFKPT